MTYTVQPLFLAEIQYWNPTTHATGTLRYASGNGYTTGPSATPASTYYDGRIGQAVDITRNLFTGGTSQGSSRVALGDVVLNNPDGLLDDLLNYGFDGRTVTIRRSTVYRPVYPTDFTTVFVGTMASAEFDSTTVRLKLRDLMYALTLPVQTTTYAGSNVLPSGLEGIATDLKGKPKPLLFGTMFNVAPPCVNTDKLIYQIHDGALAAVPNVYDRAVALGVGTPYASLAALQDDAQEPAAGYFRAYLAGGYVRLGSRPVGLVTANASEGAASANRTAAQIFARLLTRAGYSSGAWSATDVTALDTANSAELGIYLDATTTYQDVIEQVAGSVGAWWGVNRAGVFRIAQLTKPSGSAVARFTPNDLLKPLAIITTNDPGDGVPTYSVTVRYARNPNVQTTDFIDSSDIDSLATINAPAEAGAEVTTGKSIDVLVDGTHAKVLATQVSVGQIAKVVDTVENTNFSINQTRREGIMYVFALS